MCMVNGRWGHFVLHKVLRLILQTALTGKAFANHRQLESQTASVNHSTATYRVMPVGGEGGEGRGSLQVGSCRVGSCRMS